MATASKRSEVEERENLEQKVIDNVFEWNFTVISLPPQEIFQTLLSILK